MNRRNSRALAHPSPLPLSADSGETGSACFSLSRVACPCARVLHLHNNYILLHVVRRTCRYTITVNFEIREIMIFTPREAKPSLNTCYHSYDSFYRHIIHYRVPPARVLIPWRLALQKRSWSQLATRVSGELLSVSFYSRPGTSAARGGRAAGSRDDPPGRDCGLSRSHALRERDGGGWPPCPEDRPVRVRGLRHSDSLGAPAARGDGGALGWGDSNFGDPTPHYH